MSIVTDNDVVLRDYNPHWADPARRLARFQFERVQLERCVRHLAEDGSGRALALIGPRHVGKTVLVRQVADRLLERGLNPRNVLYCNLADERWPKAPSPREIVRAAEAELGSSERLYVLLDEIQVVPKWDAWLKLAVDEGRHRFLVTGSAATALRSGARESGLGRWDELAIEPLSFAEFVALTTGLRNVTELTDRPAPNALARYMTFSGFPAHAFVESAALVRERLREDIVERAIVRDLRRLRIDLEQVRRLFLHLTQSSGSILNALQRAADLEVNRKSLAKWVDVLLDTRLLVALDPTTTRQGRGAAKAARTLRARPKVHVADHGIVHAFAPVPAPLEDPHFRGQMVEAMVFRHLREAQRLVRENRESFARVGELQLGYWRDTSGEIDFVVDSRAGRIALEVTAATRPTAEKLAKLRAAARRAGATRTLVVCGGPSGDSQDGIEIVGLEEFLLAPLDFVEVTA